MRQSPQICCAFHCQASIRSEAGSSSVENSCDILCPPSPMSQVGHPDAYCLLQVNLRCQPADLRPPEGYCGENVAQKGTAVQDQSFLSITCPWQTPGRS